MARRQSNHSVQAWLEDRFRGKDISTITEIQSLPTYVTGSLDNVLGDCNAILTLNLSNCRSLTGTLLPLGHCKFLTSVNLCNCDKISGMLDALENCCALTNLNLGNCQKLTGSMDALDKCTALTCLEVFGCKNITGTLDALTACTALTKLDFSSFGTTMRVSGTLDLLWRCTALTELDLEYCRSLKGNLRALGGLTNLDKLDLGDCNKICGPLPGNIVRLISQGKANMRNCKGPFTLEADLSAVSDEIILQPLDERLHGKLDALRSCPTVTNLDLKGCQSLRGELDSLRECTALINLDLHGCCELSGSLAAIGNCTALTNIDLTNCQSLHGTLDALCNCTSLTKLNLNGCIGLIGTLSAIASCTALVSFNLSGCHGLCGPVGALGSCTSLKDLQADLCESLIGTMDELGNCSTLINITFRGCRALTGSIEALGKCTALTNLDLGNCLGLEGPISAVGKCTTMITLNLEGCKKINGDIGELRNCLAIKSLNISDCISLNGAVSPEGVAFVCYLRNANAVIQLPSSAIAKKYRNVTNGVLNFRPFRTTLVDTQLVSLLQSIGAFAEQINLSGCSQITNGAISKVIACCSLLTSLNVVGTQSTAPLKYQRDIFSLRRYYGQFAEERTARNKLKTVIVGKEKAGKSSLIRALKALEADTAFSKVPIDDNIIDVEVSILFDNFVFYDFSGHEQYAVVRENCFSYGSLYIAVADISHGVKECSTALEQQLSSIAARVPGAVALIILTKADLADKRSRASMTKEVENSLSEWLNRRHLRREDGSPLLNIQFPILSTSSETMDGIEAVRDKMRATVNYGHSSNYKDDSMLFADTYFPKLYVQVPIIYEKVRILFNAIRTGNSNLVDSVRASTSLDEKPTIKHFISFSEILEIWKAVLLDLSVLSELVEKSGSGAEQILRDALDIFEDEGFAMHSKLSDLVHLRPPTFLAYCLNALMDCRLFDAEWREVRAQEISGEWITEEDALESLANYASTGYANRSNLLRVMLEDGVLNLLRIEFDTVLRLLEEENLVYCVQRPPSRPASRSRMTEQKVRMSPSPRSAKISPFPCVDIELAAGWVVPTKLPDGPPSGFGKVCLLEDGEQAWEVTASFGIFFLPHGLIQATLASLHRLGPEVKYYRQGGVVRGMGSGMVKLVCFFDLLDYRLVLRVQGPKQEYDIKEYLELIMQEVLKVASNFDGLTVRLDYEPREVVNYDDENKRLGADLRSQWDFRDRAHKIEAQSKMTLKPHRERQEQIVCLKQRLLQIKQYDELEYSDCFESLGNSTGGLLVASRALATAHKGAIAHQHGSFFNADKLLAAATDAQQMLLEAMKRAVVAFEGSEFQPGPLKRKERIVEKAKQDYKGNYSRVVDVVRASAIFLYPTDLTAFLKRLTTADHSDSSLEVVRVKDRFNSPIIGGYRDILLNVRVVGNHHVGELQLHLKNIRAIKPRAPRLYEVLRTLGWDERRRGLA